MARRETPVVLAVGGSDPTCGAGVQSDLRTLEAFGVQPATVVTAITVQDGSRVHCFEAVGVGLVGAQLDRIAQALPVAVVKCGMLARAAIVAAVARRVGRWGVPLVVDPVLAASGGEPLGERRLAHALIERLFPLATVVTANLAEAERLSGMPVRDPAEMAAAARALADLGAAAVVIKGGHLDGDPIDVLWDGRRILRFPGARIQARDLHGSGCAFASALAAGLARRRALARSVAEAGAHVRMLIAGARATATGGWLRSPPRSC